MNHILDSFFLVEVNVLLFGGILNHIISGWNFHCALRIRGPSNGRVWTCIAGVRVLQIAIFEGTGFLGWDTRMIKRCTESNQHSWIALTITTWGWWIYRVYLGWNTVDGKNPAPLRMPQILVFPYYQKTFWGIPSGARFFPSTVSHLQP